MIDAKQAVQIAKQRAADLLGQNVFNLEEIERGLDNARDVWSITLSFPRDLDALSAITRLGADRLQYKRFLIDVTTGELVAMRLREPAAQ